MTSRALPPAWAPTEMKLSRLCEAAGLPDVREPALDLFREMVRQCRLRNPQRPPRWSGLTDDSSPIEFSVVFSSRGRQLRMLFEPQADPQSAAAYWTAGCRLTRYLARHYRARIEHARAVEGLFRPNRSDIFLAIGHAFEPMARRPPKCKVYFNAMARGTEQTRSVVGDALKRVGFHRVWKTLSTALEPSDRIELLALDLTPEQRVKLYVRPLGATLARLQSLAALSPGADIEGLARTWKRLHPARRPEQSRPTFITYHLTRPADDRPARAVLSVPLFPGIRSDSVAAGRVSGLFRDLGLDSGSYLECVRAMADGRLSEEQGIQSYVAVQNSLEDPAIVVYFNPRLYASSYGWLARAPSAIWSSPIRRPA